MIGYGARWLLWIVQFEFARKIGFERQPVLFAAAGPAVDRQNAVLRKELLNK